MINKELADFLVIRLIAIISLLQEKGILQNEEFDKKISYATALLDQAVTEVKKKREQEIKERNPKAYEVSNFFDNILGKIE